MRESESCGALLYRLQRRVTLRIVPDDSSLPDIRSPHLELRLDQSDQHAARPQQWRNRRQDQAERDERHVDHRAVERRIEIRALEVTGVDALPYFDPRIRAQSVVDLIVPDVHRHHSTCAALKQTIRESASRRADIEKGASGRVHAKRVERRGELHATATDVWVDGSLDANDGVATHGLSGLVDALLVREDESREHERLRTLTRVGESALDEQLVDTLAFRMCFRHSLDLARQCHNY